MENFGENDYMFGGLLTFKPGKHYLADCLGSLIGEYDTFVEAKRDAIDGDIILCAYNHLGNTKVLKSEPKCDKIIIDFDKKELTIGDKDVTLAKVQYEKESVYDLEPEDLTDWEGLIKDSKTVADDVEIIGVPPIAGRDITDEMSDL